MTENRVAKTACPLDCPDACSLRVTIEDGRVTSIDGDHRNRLTAGFICKKVRGFGRHVYGEERLTTPGIRRGPKGTGEFEPISWDAALELLVERIEEVRKRSSGEAILPFSYGGSNGAITEGSLDARLFRRLGATNLERTVCAAPTGAASAAMYGTMPGVPLPDYAHARLIILWGFNPSASGIHLVPPIKAARAAGAKLVVVDPRVTPLAKQADLHLRVHPGTDLPVALALHRWLFETGNADDEFIARHCSGAERLGEKADTWTLERAATVARIDPDDLRKLARWYAETNPAVIRCGWGIERNRNGGSAAAAVLALPAIAGKFGVRGGGYTMSNSRTWNLDREAAIAQPAPAVRSVNMNQLGRALTELSDPPIELLFVYNCNPLTTMPHQNLVRRGLERDDLFTVVFEQVMTDTTRFADLVLPATTFLEHDELSVGYGAQVLHRSRPAIEPVGEARPNIAVFGELIERLGLRRADDPGDADALTATLVGTDDRGRALHRRLDREHTVGPTDDGILFEHVFPRTCDAKVHLYPEALDAEAQMSGGLYAYRPDPGTEDFPLVLISPASKETISSTLGQLQDAPARVIVSPRDAETRGIHTGDRVRLFNERGSVRCLAKVDDSVPPGVLELPKGLWCRSTFDQTTSNALCPDALTDFGGGATFNDARVQLTLDEGPATSR